MRDVGSAASRGAGKWGELCLGGRFTLKYCELSCLKRGGERGEEKDSAIYGRENSTNRGGAGATGGTSELRSGEGGGQGPSGVVAGV